VFALIEQLGVLLIHITYIHIFLFLAQVHRASFYKFTKFELRVPLVVAMSIAASRDPMAGVRAIANSIAGMRCLVGAEIQKMSRENHPSI